MTISTAALKSGKTARGPLALTLTRIAAGPVVAGLALFAYAETFQGGPQRAALIYGIAAAVFALAAATDALDGAWARRAGAVTPLGAALDHAADKTLTHMTLLALAATVLPMDMIIAAALIIGRDGLVGGLREGLAGVGAAPAVDGFGKAKTFAVMAACALALALQAAALFGGPEALSAGLFLAARGLLWIGAGLALWSGAAHLAAALRQSAA